MSELAELATWFIARFCSLLKQYMVGDWQVKSPGGGFFIVMILKQSCFQRQQCDPLFAAFFSRVDSCFGGRVGSEVKV